jgi:hypothetical protein
MKEYVLACTINGIETWLQILHNSSGLYQVFWDANFIGTIEPVIDDDIGIRWITVYENLTPYTKQIGDYIMSCDS